ncbi:MAG: glycosyltransferase family 2 protein [Marinovum sp.]|nr:glycosyltransferase family 2 protein [Marinovum sp.]
MAQASWGIVMTVREPQVLVQANVAWHLALGASEIHVYFDDPRDLAAGVLGPLPGVIATMCNDAHWLSVAPAKRRPPGQMRRQALNANHALSRCKVDWLVHLDADEFLSCDGDLSEVLGHLLRIGGEIVFPVLERFYPEGEVFATVFDGSFRRSTRGTFWRHSEDTLAKTLFGDAHGALVKGVVGHSAGKCAVPRDAGLRLGIHWSFVGETRDRAPSMTMTNVHLLHFDGLTPLHFMAKLLGYASDDPKTANLPAHRLAQIDLLHEANGVPDAL